MARLEGMEILHTNLYSNIVCANAGNLTHYLFQDHMRKAGDVCFAEVSRDSEGIIFIL